MSFKELKAIQISYIIEIADTPALVALVNNNKRTLCALGYQWYENIFPDYFTQEQLQNWLCEVIERNQPGMIAPLLQMGAKTQNLQNKLTHIANQRSGELIL